jgi:hypothetical protein
MQATEVESEEMVNFRKLHIVVESERSWYEFIQWGGILRGSLRDSKSQPSGESKENGV